MASIQHVHTVYSADENVSSPSPTCDLLVSAVAGSQLCPGRPQATGEPAASFHSAASTAVQSIIAQQSGDNTSRDASKQYENGSHHLVQDLAVAGNVYGDELAATPMCLAPPVPGPAFGPTRVWSTSYRRSLCFMESLLHGFRYR